jgi:hypothetical protein
VDEKTGRMSRTLSHVLKVFLIDREAQTREIYTTSFPKSCSTTSKLC